MSLQTAFAAIIGKTAWLPRRTLGTFVTVKFGAPLLMTRHPINRDGVTAALKRRRVTVGGEQHLWIQADSWTLFSDLRPTSSSDEPLLNTQRLDVLAGQILCNVEVSETGSEFLFEYGERLRVDALDDQTQPQWSIFTQTWSGDLLSSGEFRLNA